MRSEVVNSTSTEIAKWESRSGTRDGTRDATQEWKKPLETVGKVKAGPNKISVRNGLAKDKTIFSEQSSPAIFEMDNVELIELKKSSETIQCLLCLKHVFKVQLDVNVENQYDPIKVRWTGFEKHSRH